MKRLALVFVLVNVVHAGPVLDMLKSKKIELETQKNNILANKTKLVQVYNQLMTDLIGNINSTVSEELDGFLVSIDNGQNAIKDLPPAGLQFAGIGDIGIALGAIKDVLITTKTILIGIRDRFNPIIASLDPESDPKTIYAGLNNAVGNMNKAGDEIMTFEGLVEALGL